MCGFLSALSREILLQEDIKKFKEASYLIKHRGPDDTFHILDESYFSVFHRLSIRDLTPLSRQPLVTNCGKFIICFNAKIYTFIFIDYFF